MRKKGFTLLELLAVIVVLAIIALIVTPFVTGAIKQARKGAAENSAYGIVNAAELYYAENMAKNGGELIIDENGTVKITNLIFGNYRCNGGSKTKIICKEKKEIPRKDCVFNGNLVQGATFVDGQYTYKYKQEYNYGWNGYNSSFRWINIDEDGWGIILTDKNSEDQVTTQLCTSINGKPIVSMSSMFMDSKATTLDVSNFNTSNVTDMSYMFCNSKATTLDLSSFDTNKVTRMGSMFFNIQVTEGFARTEEDAARFNASSGKPSGLNFIVKPTN